VRTWCMRGTLHLLPAEDLDGLLSAISPADVRFAWRWLERRAGLTGERARLVADTAYQVLKRDGALTRRALMAAVSAEVGFETKSAAAGVVFLNGLLGRVCFGPAKGAEPTYAALDDWLGRPIHLQATPDHVALARRYLHGYGPATPPDLAAWWGLTLGQARAAWAGLNDELTELQVDGQPVWLLAADARALAQPAPTGPTVQLLPAFDTYLLGYANRELAVPKRFQKHIFHGGQVVPAVMVDGLAAGTWRYEQRGKQMRIAVTAFAGFSRAERDLIAAEAEDVGRFYAVKTVLSYAS
jgi:Winged helix DNA-binding domain